MLIAGLSKASLTDSIKSKVLELGFYGCGISEAVFLEDDALHMEQWLEEGCHGEMTYLEKNREKRYHPALLVKETKSVISVLYNYYPDTTLPSEDNYVISKYAYGNDYHFVMKNKLNELLAFVEEKTGERKARAFVDSAPMLDRAWAHKSGLGFIGKNTCLINKKGGSFFFIGHLLLDLELQ